MRELELIEYICRRGLRGAGRGRVRVGPGDDCAVLGPPRRGRELLLKTDGLVAGVHFDRRARPVEVGYKAICRPLSDVAACGGSPVAAVVFVALNRNHSGAWARGFQRGLEKAGRLFGCPTVGGDVSGTRGPTTIATGLLGEVKRGRALLRSGARPGDRIFVTGRLGGSILGKHLRFAPRLEEGRLLSAFRGVGACIDVSDGLARDLAHVLKESGGLGAEIRAESVPVSAAARRLKGDALKHALSDGEDYELLFTVRPARAAALARRWKFRTRLTEIGEVLPKRGGVWLITGRGRRRLKPRGWEHL
ncbi:MAG: thiamine-phosphate kinase [Planctomycetota bacterium]